MICKTTKIFGTVPPGELTASLGPVLRVITEFVYPGLKTCCAEQVSTKFATILLLKVNWVGALHTVPIVFDI